MSQQLENINNQFLQNNSEYPNGVDFSNKKFEEYDDNGNYQIPADPRKPFATPPTERGVEPINSSGERVHQIKKANWDSENIWQEQKKLQLHKNFGYNGNGMYTDDNMDIQGLLDFYHRNTP